MKENTLEVNHLRIDYKTDLETVHAVNDISFSLKEGETFGIVGETGVGKTTTALALMRLLPERVSHVEADSIKLNGKNLMDLTEAEMREIRGEQIAMIFQDPMTSLNPVLTVGDQIYEALQLHNTEHKSKEELEKRVDDVLSMVGIDPRRKGDYPHQFSGGMKQRVVIAMALSCEPHLLIADEPTTALDVTIQAQVLTMIRDLRNRLHTTTILITHDLGVIAQVCDSVAVMYAGELIEIGTLEDIFSGSKHHPYTVGLFGSIPDLKVKSKRLTPIPGLMPDPSNLPKGCKFSPRCPQCMEICKGIAPSYWEDGTHKISCHLYTDGKELKYE